MDHIKYQQELTMHLMVGIHQQVVEHNIVQLRKVLMDKRGMHNGNQRLTNVLVMNVLLT